MAKASPHKWEFRARFRRHAFGWKSQPAIKRIKEAVAEIKKVARKDKVLAAEGAVLFLEKVSPALRSEEHTSELQSRENLVCRLLLEKKKRNCISKAAG